MGTLSACLSVRLFPVSATKPLLEFSWYPILNYFTSIYRVSINPIHIFQVTDLHYLTA